MPPRPMYEMRYGAKRSCSFRSGCNDDGVSSGGARVVVTVILHETDENAKRQGVITHESDFARRVFAGALAHRPL